MVPRLAVAALPAALAGAATAVLLAAGRGGSGGNAMRRGLFLPGKFAVLVALLGPGTMALHATMTAWGGALDTVSMYLFGAFVLAYALHRLGAYAAPLVPVAFAAWLGSHIGGPLCRPQSLLQGHAAWHILTALAAGALYLHYWNEPVA